MKWLDKKIIGIVLLLELLLLGIFGYSNNIEGAKKALVILGISIIFVGYLISFKMRADILSYFIGEKDPKKEKTLIKAIGMLLFLVGVTILGFIFAI